MSDYETANLRATLAVLGAQTVLHDNPGLTVEQIRCVAGDEDFALDEIRDWLETLEENCLAQRVKVLGGTFSYIKHDYDVWTIRPEGLIALWTQLPWEAG
jgi:hypothetical protein